MDLKLAEKNNHRQLGAVEAAYELGIGSCCKDGEHQKTQAGLELNTLSLGQNSTADLGACIVGLEQSGNSSLEEMEPAEDGRRKTADPGLRDEVPTSPRMVHLNFELFQTNSDFLHLSLSKALST